MGDHAYLRASDGDREEVAETLRQAHAEGRLEFDEFEERVAAVYRAKTYGELDAVVRDLPSARTGPRGGPWAAGPTWPRRRRRPNWSRFVLVNGVCWALWASQLVGHHGPEVLWPLWVTAPWGAWRVSRLLGRRRPAPPARLQP